MLGQIQVFSHPFSTFPGSLLASWSFSLTLAKCPHTGGWASSAFGDLGVFWGIFSL